MHQVRGEDDVYEETIDSGNFEGNEQDTTGVKVESFQFKPSKRLQEMEDMLSGEEKEFIQDGKMKETVTKLFLDSINTDVVRDGFAKANHEWQMLVEGPEASRVIGTFGDNLNKIVTSAGGAEIINTVAATAHILLSKAGEKVPESGINKILSMTFSLFTSPEIPDIVNKTGELVVTAADKSKAPLFIRRFWDEVNAFMGDKDLNSKLNMYFTNILSIMRILHNQQNSASRR